MAKKSDKAEIDRRIHTVVKLLSSAKTNSYIVRFCTEEWEVQKRQAEAYLQRAREIIKADYSVERSDFLGTRLALLVKSSKPASAASNTAMQLGLSSFRRS